MKVGVVTFPGSNCDDDTFDVLARCLEFQVNSIWHKSVTSLSGFDLVVLPGGFSYGDYLRSGAMASVSPIMASVKEFAQAGGLVLGICNGFQILCESRMLRGALTRNNGLSFVCKDVEIKVESQDSPWTEQVPVGQSIKIPIAHGEGRYVAEQSDIIDMKTHGEILMTYVTNPNGSMADIAGICNREKNIFGLMPHPERATDLRSRDGLKIWKSIAGFVERKRVSS